MDALVQSRRLGCSGGLREQSHRQLRSRLHRYRRSLIRVSSDASSSTEPSLPSVAPSASIARPNPSSERVGTCVQVPHQSFLDMGPSSDSFWTLVTCTLVPPHDRQDMAILLACLESVYRAEYQQLAAEAIAAITAANNAHVRRDGSVGEAADQLPSPLQEQPQQPWLQRSSLPGAASRGGAVGGFGVHSDSESDTEADFAGGVADPDGASSSVDEEGDGIGGGGGRWGRRVITAADLDAEALRRLMRLARRAGYQPLTVRDVRLADSLNTDYLSQLFIKGSTRRLDGALVQDLVDPSLPAEARPVLLLQRGYGTELQAGRLLLQKLDYLQTLAVGRAGSWLGGAAAALAAVLFGTFEDGAGGAGSAAFYVDAMGEGERPARSKHSEEAGGTGRGKGEAEESAGSSDDGWTRLEVDMRGGDVDAGPSGGEESAERLDELPLAAAGTVAAAGFRAELDEPAAATAAAAPVVSAAGVEAKAGTPWPPGEPRSSPMNGNGTDGDSGRAAAPPAPRSEAEEVQPVVSGVAAAASVAVAASAAAAAFASARARRRSPRRQRGQAAGQAVLPGEVNAERAAGQGWRAFAAAAEPDAAVGGLEGRATRAGAGAVAIGPQTQLEAAETVEQQPCLRWRPLTEQASANVGTSAKQSVAAAVMMERPSSSAGDGPAAAAAASRVSLSRKSGGELAPEEGGEHGEPGRSASGTEALMSEPGGRSSELAAPAPSARALAVAGATAAEAVEVQPGGNKGAVRVGQPATMVWQGPAGRASVVSLPRPPPSGFPEESSSYGQAAAAGGAPHVGNDASSLSVDVPVRRHGDASAFATSSGTERTVPDGAEEHAGPEAGLCGTLVAASTSGLPSLPLAARWGSASDSGPRGPADGAAPAGRDVTGADYLAAPADAVGAGAGMRGSSDEESTVEEGQWPASEAAMIEAAREQQQQQQQPGPWATAFSRVYSALSDWGLVPRTDVIPLAEFNSHFPVRERPGRPPLRICKVSLGDALGGADWLRGGVKGLVDGLLREVQLQEPTYREVLVLYRPAHSRMLPPREPEQAGSANSSGLFGSLGFGWGTAAAPAGERGRSRTSRQRSGPGTQQERLDFGDNAWGLAHQGSGAGSTEEWSQQQWSEGEEAQEERGRGGNSEGPANGRASSEEAGGRRRRRRSGKGSGSGGVMGLRSGWLRRLLTFEWLRRGADEPAIRRPPIQIRIYRDIPVPTWKVVLPEKLLQFRPLDLLRVDLFALAGLAGLAAQARYDNTLVDIITFGSAAVLLVRIVLGYQRMADRFRSMVNELLAEKALAGQEGAVEALAMAAAQQQLRQAALAYVLLLHHHAASETQLYDTRPGATGGGGERGGPASRAGARRQQEPAAEVGEQGLQGSPGWLAWLTGEAVGAATGAEGGPGSGWLWQAAGRLGRAAEGTAEPSEAREGAGGGAADATGSGGPQGQGQRLAEAALPALPAPCPPAPADLGTPAVATTARLQELAEWALAYHSGVRVRFNACQALHELQRLGLVVRVSADGPGQPCGAEENEARAGCGSSEGRRSGSTSSDDEDPEYDSDVVYGAVYNYEDFVAAEARRSLALQQQEQQQEQLLHHHHHQCDQHQHHQQNQQQEHEGEQEQEKEQEQDVGSRPGAATHFGERSERAEPSDAVGSSSWSEEPTGVPSGLESGAGGLDPFRINISVTLPRAAGGSPDTTLDIATATPTAAAAPNTIAANATGVDSTVGTIAPTPVSAGSGAAEWRAGLAQGQPGLSEPAVLSNAATNIVETQLQGTSANSNSGDGGALGVGFGGNVVDGGTAGVGGNVVDGGTVGVGGLEGSTQGSGARPRGTRAGGCRCEDPHLGCDGAEGCGCGQVWWAAVPLRDAVPVVEDHWAGLLWRRVGAILRRRDVGL